MKNFLFFLLFGGLASLCSCTKSDPPPSVQDLLVGKWNITSLIDIDGDEMVYNEEPDYTTTVTLQFSADGTVNFELKYTELATGETQIETSAGTYTWETDTTIRIALPDTVDPSLITVLTGVPVVVENTLSADFTADAPDEDGTVKLKGERL